MIDAFVEGDLEASRESHMCMLPLVRALFPAGWSSPISVKSALNLAGFEAGLPRLPLVDLPQDMKDRLEDLLSGYSLDPFLSGVAVS